MILILARHGKPIYLRVHRTMKKALKTPNLLLQKGRNQAQEPKSHRCHLLNKYEKNNVATRIASLNLDSLTLSCLLTVSKQLEHINDSLKQFYDSLVPSELLFLTFSRNDLIANWIAKCEVSLIAWIFASDELVFAHAPHGSPCCRPCFIECLFNNAQCLWWSTGLSNARSAMLLSPINKASTWASKSVLFVYGIIIESMGLTWRSVCIQGILTVGYSPPYIYIMNSCWYSNI